MNIPGFSGNVSLYKTKGQYRNFRSSSQLFRHMDNVINPAAEAPTGQPPIEVPGEVIVIEDIEMWRWWERGGIGNIIRNIITITVPQLPGGGDGGIPTGPNLLTLGRHNYSDVKKYADDCVNAGVGAQECYDCVKDKETQKTSCTCWYCVPGEGKCTESYDCTDTYG
jgi:hypothetical protein